MADTKIVGGKGFVSEGNDHDHDKSKDHLRVKKLTVRDDASIGEDLTVGGDLSVGGGETLGGNLTVGGSETVAGNLIVNGTVTEGTSPAFAPSFTTIYVRSTGSDTTGDGSLANPFATLQRAAQAVPLIVPPGAIFRIDITGLDETLPPDYTLPAWKAPLDSFNLPPPNPFTIFQPAVEIFATPRPISTIPLADTIINAGDVASVTTDPLTKLKTVNLIVPRPSWVAGSTIKGKLVIDGAAAVVNTVVAEVTASSILLAVSASPTFPLQLVEPSAHLHGSPTNSIGAINGDNIDSFGFTGVKITSDSGTQGLGADGNGTCICQLCELQSPFFGQTSGGVFYSNANRAVRCWIYGFPTFCGVSGIVQALLDKIDVTTGPFFVAPATATFRSVVCDGANGPLEVTVFEPGGTVDGATASHLTMKNTLVKNSAGDGLAWHGGKGRVLNSDFASNTGNGITVSQGGGLLDLDNVGSSMANGGFGIRITDGMQVLADVATTTNASPLTGAGGNISLGSVGVVTWATVAAPPNNVADFAGAAATGARVAQG